MVACTYRKMVCNAGHSSRAYGAEEPLPRRCPICGQPYDRRYNRPVFCLEDGTVPEERDKQAEPDREMEESKQAEPEIQTAWSAPVNGEAQPGGMRRGRQLSPLGGAPEHLSDGQPMARPNPPQPEFVQGRRPRNLAPLDPLPSDDRRSEDEMDDPGVRYVEWEPAGKRVMLCVGGERIRVPESGAYLGRMELGGASFAMNPLISRRHAYVRADRFGNLEVRDEDSLNGTYVDDGKGRRRLQQGETVQLKAGATLWLANQILAVEEEER